MDRRDAMAMSGSGAFYMQRGINQFADTEMPFQSNSIQMETSPAIPSHGVNSAIQAQSEAVKRKRGRPRKYGPNPNGNVSLPLSPSLSTQKRGRGRPPGTGRKQQLASLGEWLSSSAGMGFTPHIINIAVGEDIRTKIMSISQQGPRAICVLSANGAVSTVTLSQPSTSGATVTYEGRFEILCLSGSYLVSNDCGSLSRTGGLSVALASPEGLVIGGRVGGVLIAASPVQVIVGSFLWGGSKMKNKKEGTDGSQDLDHQRDENPSSIQHNQNLISNSSVSLWPGSIDLMQG